MIVISGRLLFWIFILWCVWSTLRWIAAFRAFARKEELQEAAELREIKAHMDKVKWEHERDRREHPNLFLDEKERRTPGGDS
jgi:hypothetical protein